MDDFVPDDAMAAVLFREIAHAFNEFQSAVQFGGTTAGEETRLYGVVDSAVATWLWLRAGEV